MIKRKLWGLLYILIVLGTLAAAEWGCRTVSVMVESAPLKRGNCIIIDAGHGGEDGGATSCRGFHPELVEEPFVYYKQLF